MRKLLLICLDLDEPIDYKAFALTQRRFLDDDTETKTIPDPSFKREIIRSARQEMASMMYWFFT